MIPDRTLVTPALPSDWLHAISNDPLVDHEMGGIALRDASQGLSVKLWTATYDGTHVLVSDGTTTTTLFPATGVVHLGLAFDQNMNPFVAYVDGTGAHYWWYDTVAQAQVFSDLPGAITPCCTLDDHRELQSSSSDIILAYLKDGGLRYRQQRDRFATEYLLELGPWFALVAVGLNKTQRLQFKAK
jgi:hypothetical protein